MVVLCDMVLDNPQLIYLPGDVVSGRITLTLDERRLIKAVAIKISGYAQTRWEKPIKDKKQKKNKAAAEVDQQFYTNREDYISTTHYFIGSDAATAKVIDAGVYEYNFSVLLPENCASVFESLLGHIRYELDVFIVFPEQRQSCYFRNIHVSRPLDLSKIPGINQEHDVETIEKKSIIKFWQRPLQLQVNLPKAGFVSGENISVYTKLLNYDLLDLTDITYKLNLVSTYTGLWKKKAKMHISRTNLVTTVHSLFGKNGNVVQHLQNIMVPETPPTLELAECRCMQISYEIEVVVSTNQKNRRISAFLPLAIGTVSAQSNLQTMPNEITASAPVLTATRSIEDLLAAHPDDTNVFEQATAPAPETPTQVTRIGPTSSFREADFMTPAKLNKNKSHTKSMGNIDEFKPKYLYYDMPIPEQTDASIHPEHPNPNSTSNEKTRF